MLISFWKEIFVLVIFLNLVVSLRVVCVEIFFFVFDMFDVNDMICL